ncbi:hypothetical protein BABINDRAFT_162099 [Babjeviella inositovora NRRL Y-12698]|uniref:Protein transport protein SEC23 n=1 Tax=Babjeviella inositovora NRRL Y-12698 TaxID=984486 RepID=A0A1E3QN18_9ASCO|nr:uncharacterized protein BABINDRAFT_162099 [Babjeviella inositovora NRRL Y-12698]ODQ79030.1 hypothetical protein BABINDRAFT_162099 [Babjeviella inositovora NRRL Y-12698]
MQHVTKTRSIRVGDKPTTSLTTKWYVTFFRYSFGLHANQQDFETAEDTDGVRLTWNAIPQKQFDATRCVIPLASLYTPLKYREDLAIVQEEVLPCSQCKAIINPFCPYDPALATWSCAFCHARNRAPPHFQQTQSIPSGTAASTIEYVLPNRDTRRIKTPPIFVYVVDSVNDEENLAALRESLILSMNLLPLDALVGFISYGRNVSVYELGAPDAIRTFAFNGTKEYTAEQVTKTLGLLSADLRQQEQQYTAAINARFFQPVAMAEYQLTTIMEELIGDAFPYNVKRQRPARCTGAALNVAQLLVANCAAKTGAHVMLFAGGPCTTGPGTIVSAELKEAMRSHHEIIAESPKYFAKARHFYDALAQRFADVGHAVDVFVGCYDQVGLYEMSSLPDKTGGVVILSDAFATAIFKQSLVRMFSKSEDGVLEFGLNASLEVKVSKELKLNGLIGHAESLKNKNASVSEMVVGTGGTAAWKLCNVAPQSTYGIYFEVNGNDTQLNPGQVTNAFIQYIMHYENPVGENRLRVTTIARPIVPATSPALVSSFDQEAAAVLIARQAVSKLHKGQDAGDVIKWLDRILINMCSRFAEYSKNNVATFRLAANFSLFPQFMYHLRRSQFCQVFNNSPDETSFYRHVFLTEDTNNSLIMIQPTLTAYEVEWAEPQPVLLDSLSITANRILLLDTFFHVLIFHGESIAAWRKAGYQDMEDYAYFKDFLAIPKQEAADLLVERFPLPRFIDCDQGGSQARFLMSKLNPTTTYNDSAVAQGTVILTDDVSLQSFMDHVQKKAVV